MKFSQKKFENWRFWKLAILEFFFSEKNFFLLHPNKNQSQIMWWNGWDSILMFSLVSTKFLAMRNISLYSVLDLKIITDNFSTIYIRATWIDAQRFYEAKFKRLDYKVVFIWSYFFHSVSRYHILEGHAYSNSKNMTR